MYNLGLGFCRHKARWSIFDIKCSIGLSESREVLWLIEVRVVNHFSQDLAFEHDPELLFQGRLRFLILVL